MNNAEIHAEIAKAVWTDHMVMVNTHDDYCMIRERKSCAKKFDLLETENGKPTQQAKASAFDTLAWLDDLNHEDYPNTGRSVAEIMIEYSDLNITPESIFNAAKEVVQS